ncbi:MAG: hypothetical protein VX228_02220, partial [Pseudomonadota bacterium]|nr:hypothetical protein [Pseudomonadota bacterium]
PLLMEAGKLASRSSSVRAVAGAGSSTLYVLDTNTNTFLLVDSGAEVSLLPATHRDRSRPATGPPLVAANGQPIASYSRRRSTLLLDGQQFSWSFIIADTPVGVLGADFLVHHTPTRRSAFWVPTSWFTTPWPSTSNAGSCSGGSPLTGRPSW